MIPYSLTSVFPGYHPYKASLVGKQRIINRVVPRAHKTQDAERQPYKQQ